jgi:hypothetical protein
MTWIFCMQASEHWKCSPLDEVATCYMILDQWDCSNHFGLLRYLEPYFRSGAYSNAWSGEQTAGLNLRPSVAGTVHRSVGSSSPNGAETNTVGSSILLTKKTISLKQLNVQRTFKFLSSSLLSTFNNPVSQAVFQSLRSKLCGLKDFCEV